jgi:hypothetical protein
VVISAGFSSLHCVLDMCDSMVIRGCGQLKSVNLLQKGGCRTIGRPGAGHRPPGFLFD